MSNANRFDYELFLFENKTWLKVSKWLRPFADKDNLDNSLDLGSFTLWHTPRKQCYAPFTPMRFEIFEMNNLGERIHKDTIYRLIADATVNQVVFSYDSNSVDLYDHNYSTIELTKVLERVGCETLSVTDYLGHDFLSGAARVVPDIQASSPDGDVIFPEFSTKLDYFSPVSSSIPFTIHKLDDVIYIPPEYIESGIIITKGLKFYWVEGQGLFSRELNAFDDHEWLLSNSDAPYAIEYTLTLTQIIPEIGASHHEIWKYKYNLQSVATIERKNSDSLGAALERMLAVVPLRREGVESIHYKLDPIWLDKFYNIKAGEIFVSQKSLWEILCEFTANLHLIPRLIWNEIENEANIITFDELGKNDQSEIIERIAAYKSEIKIDDYCGKIDSTIENVVNTLDVDEGSVIEPADGAFKTMRCEEGSLDITDDTACILLSKKIYRILQVELGYLNDGSFVGSITPHIYEQAEFDVLQHGGYFPFSKMYALVYKQGDNKITGLSQKYNTYSGSPVGEVDEPAINKIFSRKGLIKTTPLKDIAYRVQYIPYTSARIIQKKPYIGEFPENNTLIYNQSESTIEARSYGENMKGAIARMGNAKETRTYVFKSNYEKIPKIGTLIEGKYVSSVARGFKLNSIIVTIELSENFNQLMQQLGINSNYRAYDISEKQSYERFVVYSEDVILGDKENTDGAKCGITSAGVLCFANYLNSDLSTKISCAEVECMDKSNSPLKKVLLPVCSQAYGNTLSFQFGFQDNYSAGMQSVAYTALKNEQRAVQYTDSYGEVEKLKVRLFDSAPNISGLNEQTSGLGSCNLLPELNKDVGTIVLFNYADYPFIVKKDSREYLNLNLNLCFRANRKSLVIGAGLARYNTFITKKKVKKAIYFFNQRLNLLNSYVVLNDARLITDSINFQTVHSHCLMFPQILNNTGSDYKSWGLVAQIYNAEGLQENILIFGENKSILNGEKTDAVYFTFKNN